jgi:hypothetical protein
VVELNPLYLAGSVMPPTNSAADLNATLDGRSGPYDTVSVCVCVCVRVCACVCVVCVCVCKGSRRTKQRRPSSY